MDIKKKTHNIMLIFTFILLVLVIAIAYKNLLNAIISSNITQILIFGIPVLIVLGSFVSMIKIRLKLNKEKE